MKDRFVSRLFSFDLLFLLRLDNRIIPVRLLRMLALINLALVSQGEL